MSCKSTLNQPGINIPGSGKGFTFFVARSVSEGDKKQTLCSETNFTTIIVWFPLLRGEEAKQVFVDLHSQLYLDLTHV
jgi:hypothetical protein